MVLVDGSEPVADITQAGVGQKLALCLELVCVLSGEDGQGGAPMSPLLAKIPGLLRNGSRVRQVTWRVIGNHVVVGDKIRRW